MNPSADPEANLLRVGGGYPLAQTTCVSAQLLQVPAVGCA